MAAANMSEANRASERVARQLDRDAKKLACDWWETDTAVVIVDLVHAGAFGVVLAAITETIHRTRDPLWVVGQSTAAAAHSVAWEWLRAGVEPADVSTWLRAGCWDPRTARALGEAGIRPADLLDDDGRPRYLVDGPGGEPMPLAQAVADKHLAVDDAARIAGSPAAPS